MQFNELDSLKIFSLEDTIIEKMELNVQKKDVTLIFKYGVYKIDESYDHVNGYLTIYDWVFLSVKYFNHKTESWENLHEINYETLRDVCEIKLEGRQVFFNGFGIKSGNWVSWNFESPKILAKFLSG